MSPDVGQSRRTARRRAMNGYSISPRRSIHSDETYRGFRESSYPFSCDCQESGVYRPVVFNEF